MNPPLHPPKENDRHDPEAREAMDSHAEHRRHAHNKKKPRGIAEGCDPGEPKNKNNARIRGVCSSFRPMGVEARTGLPGLIRARLPRFPTKEGGASLVKGKPGSDLINSIGANPFNTGHSNPVTL